MFINISNHPSSSWQTEQLEEARKYGVMYDIPFPVIPADWGAEEVATLVGGYAKKIKDLLPEPDDSSVIHLMGETVFTFMLASLLLTEHYIVIASTTERIVSYEKDKKVSVFRFVRFRPYQFGEVK